MILKFRLNSTILIQISLLLMKITLLFFESHLSYILAVPCTIPLTSLGHFQYNGKEMAEHSTIEHGEVVSFFCMKGYIVLGSNIMRCWYGEWAVTGSNPECKPGKCIYGRKYFISKFLNPYRISSESFYTTLHCNSKRENGFKLE